MANVIAGMPAGSGQNQPVTTGMGLDTPKRKGGRGGGDAPVPAICASPAGDVSGAFFHAWDMIHWSLDGVKPRQLRRARSGRKCSDRAGRLHAWQLEAPHRAQGGRSAPTAPCSAVRRLHAQAGKVMKCCGSNSIPPPPRSSQADGQILRVPRRPTHGIRPRPKKRQRAAKEAERPPAPPISTTNHYREFAMRPY